MGGEKSNIARPPITKAAAATTTPTFLGPGGRAAGKNKTRWTLVVQFSFFFDGGGVTRHLFLDLLAPVSQLLSVCTGREKRNKKCFDSSGEVS